MRRQRTSGSVAELPRHPGPAPRLDVAGDERLLACLKAQPDATLAEIGQALVAARQCSARPCGRRWNGWGRKKSVHAAERDTARGLWPVCCLKMRVKWLWSEKPVR